MIGKNWNWWILWLKIKPNLRSAKFAEIKVIFTIFSFFNHFFFVKNLCQKGRVLTFSFLMVKFPRKLEKVFQNPVKKPDLLRKKLVNTEHEKSLNFFEQNAF